MTIAEPPRPSFVDVDEAKRQLCLSTTALYAYMKAGELTRIKLGRKTVLSQADIDNFVERKLAQAGLPSSYLDIDGMKARFEEAQARQAGQVAA